MAYKCGIRENASSENIHVNVSSQNQHWYVSQHGWHMSANMADIDSLGYYKPDISVGLKETVQQLECKERPGSTLSPVRFEDAWHGGPAVSMTTVWCLAVWYSLIHFCQAEQPHDQSGEFDRNTSSHLHSGAGLICGNHGFCVVLRYVSSRPFSVGYVISRWAPKTVPQKGGLEEPKVLHGAAPGFQSELTLTFSLCPTKNGRWYGPCSRLRPFLVGQSEVMPSSPEAGCWWCWDGCKSELSLSLIGLWIQSMTILTNI